MCIFSEDIGMEFGLKKSTVLILRGEKLANSEGIKLPDDVIMKVIKVQGYILTFGHKI